MRAWTHASTRPSRRRARAAGAAAVLAAICMGAAACGAGTTADDPVAAETATADPGSGNALRPPRPLQKPDLKLTDDEGRPFDLVKETAGKPTLLFFGYTHCPDVCPTTLADLATAVKKLPEADQDRVRVVFVTTDPARDKPKRVHKWLQAFDDRFIGLTGDFDAIRNAARSVGVAVEKPVENDDGTVTATHGGQVLAFSPSDDRAHVIFTSGATTEQFSAELPGLVKGEA
ncbi:MAG TPA: SCO family protein [Vulgatibacteraceae bacterium]|nr:SCO family protein [Vulgatibacteraceae bacterium]